MSCNPLVNQIGTTSTCTATVTDTEVAGTASPPTGTVTFTFVNSTTGTTSQAVHALAGRRRQRASCNVTYSSTSPAVVTVTAAYGGSNVHKPSNSNADPIFVVFFDPTGRIRDRRRLDHCPGWVLHRARHQLQLQPLVDRVRRTSASSPSTRRAPTSLRATRSSSSTQPDSNFKSTAYEWLVVAGSKAQFKGTGTINGGGNYTFQLFANDNTPGSSDAFRIKIWETATGTMIFDNKSDQAIGGGSIVVHKG